MSEETSQEPSTDTAQEDADPNHGKKGRGNKWTPTEEQRRQTKELSALGIPIDKIAIVIGVSAPTLRRACKSELALGAPIADANVLKNLYRMATDPRTKNPAAAIYWTKARLGWRDRDAAGGAENPAKKQERKDAAKRVGGAGKFAPGKGPKLSVVK